MAELNGEAEEKERLEKPIGYRRCSEKLLKQVIKAPPLKRLRGERLFNTLSTERSGQMDKTNADKDPFSGTKPINTKQPKSSVLNGIAEIICVDTETPGVHQKQSTTETESTQDISAAENALVNRIKASDRWMIGLTAIIAVSAIINGLIFLP